MKSSLNYIKQDNKVINVEYKLSFTKKSIGINENNRGISFEPLNLINNYYT